MVYYYLYANRSNLNLLALEGKHVCSTQNVKYKSTDKLPYQFRSYFACAYGLPAPASIFYPNLRSFCRCTTTPKRRINASAKCKMQPNVKKTFLRSTLPTTPTCAIERQMVTASFFCISMPRDTCADSAPLCEAPFIIHEVVTPFRWRLYLL